MQNRKYVRLYSFLFAMLIAFISIPYTDVFAAEENDTELSQEENLDASAESSEARIKFNDLLIGEMPEETDLSLYEKIEISTEEDLYAVAEMASLDSWSFDKYIVLTDDINLVKYKKLSIPIFSGVFEGNGHTISGLKITEAGSKKGFFRFAQKSAQILNLKVEGYVVPEGSADSIGILVGENYGYTEGCAVNGTCMGDENVGGLVGHNGKDAIITNC